MQKTELLNDFIFDCQSRSRVKRTLETYKGNVGEFLDHFPEPEKVDKHDLREYLSYLQERNLKISTLKGYFSALSTFYDYLIYQEIAETNPILPFRRRYLDKPIKNDKRQLITVKAMKQLIRSIEPIREQAMLMTLAKHGVRLGEYLGLKDEHIDLRKNQITYPQKAKRNNRILPVDDELHEVLIEYKRWRKKHETSPWFWVTEHGGGRIHKDYTNAVISQYAEPLGLHEPKGALEKRLTCHCFRKWFTHHLFAAGMEETNIMILRGDSLKKHAWSGSYLEPDELTEQVKEEYLRHIPKLL